MFSLLAFMLSTTNPFMACIILTSLALLLGSFLSFTLSKWIGIAIVLVFLGGMMVIFIYASSLSKHNKIMKMNMSFQLIIPLITFNLLFSLSMNPPQFLSISLIYSMISLPFLLLLIFYLLLTLFTVVKISQCFKGPLVKFN